MVRMSTVKIHIAANIHTFLVLNPFRGKQPLIKSLFPHAFKICISKELFENQINTLKSSMSWNGYPKQVRNFLIDKLKCKYNTSFSIPPQNSSINDNLPKIWIRIPYLGKQSENLVKSCISEIRRQFTNPVKFVIIFNTKKVSYFTSTKDKIPELSHDNVVY